MATQRERLPTNVEQIFQYLRRTQAGRRLVPDRSYRDFRFRPDPDDVGATTSRQW